MECLVEIWEGTELLDPAAASGASVKPQVPQLLHTVHINTYTHAGNNSW